MFYLYISTIAIFDLIAVVMVKMWHLKGNLLYLIASMIAFAVTAVFAGLSLKYEGIAIVNVLWVSLSTILVTIVGYYIFKESISIQQFIGMAIILLGLIIVEYR